MEFDLEGKTDRRGRERSIYSERFIHSEVYKARSGRQRRSSIATRRRSFPFSVTQVPIASGSQHRVVPRAPRCPCSRCARRRGMTNNLVTDGARAAKPWSRCWEIVRSLCCGGPRQRGRGPGSAANGVARNLYRGQLRALLLQAVMLGGPHHLHRSRGEQVDRVRAAARRSAATASTAPGRCGSRKRRAGFGEPTR